MSGVTSTSGSSRKRPYVSATSRTGKYIRFKRSSSVPEAMKRYVARQIDKAIEDKYDTTPQVSAQTFACFSGDSTPNPDTVASGHLTITALPSFTQGVDNGGETGQYIGNEIKLKKTVFDATFYPQSNATKYGRLIKVYLVQLIGANAQSQFDVEDCFENDWVLDSLNSANYPGIHYMTPRNTVNDNFKSVYKVLKTWKFEVPQNINAADGSNWCITKRFVYDFKGKKIRYDNAGNPLNYDCRIIFTTDVGNDGSSMVTPAMVGTITTAGNTGVNMIYKRKSYYEDA